MRTELQSDDKTDTIVELTEMDKYRKAAVSPIEEIVAELDKPLTLQLIQDVGNAPKAEDGSPFMCARIRQYWEKRSGYVQPYVITSGVLWLTGPWAEQFWPERKPAKPKHACPTCGRKHTVLR